MNESAVKTGLEGVVAGETAISTIAGGLQYRGYSIGELSTHASFEEVAFLILKGNLPTANELKDFRQDLGASIAVPDELITILGMLPDTTPMMDVMRTGASLLAHWDADTGDSSMEANLRKSLRLLSQLPVVLAARHRLRRGEDVIPPDPNLSLAANLLLMLNGEPPDHDAEKALDLTLILYAEHEFNASTFTARVVTSTRSDMHSAITAAIGALKGSLHGGANEQVMALLSEVETPANALQWVHQALAQKRRVMGFGHRVYRDGDPRASILKPLCHELAAAVGKSQIEETAEMIEKVMLDEKGLRPNLDWPSARLYYYLGLPVDMYTPLFVVSRVVGWSAHVIEQTETNRLIRPRANYIGPKPRPWLPMSDR